MRWFGLASVVSLNASLACGSGTDLNQIVNVNPVSEAGAGAGEGGGGSTFQNPFAGAPGYTPQMGPDAHNAGQPCMQSGCHGSSEAPGFLIGGTVYTDYKGTTPAVGVEVRIVDSQGRAASAYTGQSGNFFIHSVNANGVTFPAVVGARNATTTRPMITVLSAAGMGSCGQAKCHVPGGGPQSGTGNYYPIHVP
jgi:hypothetical protein